MSTSKRLERLYREVFGEVGEPLGDTVEEQEAAELGNEVQAWIDACEYEYAKSR